MFWDPLILNWIFHNFLNVKFSNNSFVFRINLQGYVLLHPSKRKIPNSITNFLNPIERRALINFFIDAIKLLDLLLKNFYFIYKCQRRYLPSISYMIDRTKNWITSII